MGEIRYETQDEFRQRRFEYPGPDLTGRLVAWGVAANRDQAIVILLAVAACAAVIGIFFAMRGGTADKLPDEEVLRKVDPVYQSAPPSNSIRP